MSKKKGGFESTFLEARKAAKKAYQYIIKEGIPEVEGELAYFGRRIVHELAQNKETKSITGNQEDGYVWILSYNGDVRKYGFVSNKYMSDRSGQTQRTSNRYGRWARLDAMNYAHSYHPYTTQGYELMIVNVAYYSYYHQSPTHGRRRYWIVSKKLSEAWVELERRYSGFVVGRQTTLMFKKPLSQRGKTAYNRKEE